MNVPLADHLFAQPVVFLLRAIAPMDVRRFAQRGPLGDPANKLFVLNKRWNLDTVRTCLIGCSAWSGINT